MRAGILKSIWEQEYQRVYAYILLITNLQLEYICNMSVTGAAGTAYPSRPFEFTTVFSEVRVTKSLFFSALLIVVCLFLLFLLVIVISADFRHTDLTLLLWYRQIFLFLMFVKIFLSCRYNCFGFTVFKL
jgi:hypothetical protein